MKGFVLLTLIFMSCNPTLLDQEISDQDIPNPSEWELVWSDEFNEPVGTSPDSARWNHEIGGHGFGNQQLEFNTDRSENASTDGNGHLRITALKEQFGSNEFTSARITTQGKFEQRYGRFEFRAKMPRGSGLWPALWLLAADFETNTWPNCGEIDAMEMRGQSPWEIIGSLHGPQYFGGSSLSRSLSISPSADEAFHRYMVIWNESRIQWFVDDQLYHEVSKISLPSGADWVFDRPFFIIMNLAVGGQFVGSVSPSTAFPAQMLVDYVRVYRFKGGLD